MWLLAKKKVGFEAKNNGHQNFTKSLGIPEPLPPCLGNIPKIYQFFRLSASPTQPVDRKRLRFLISFLQNQQLAWLLHHEEHWLCAHWWSGKGFAQVVIITISRQTLPQSKFMLSLSWLRFLLVQDVKNQALCKRSPPQVRHSRDRGLVPHLLLRQRCERTHYRLSIVQLLNCSIVSLF